MTTEEWRSNLKYGDEVWMCRTHENGNRISIKHGTVQYNFDGFADKSKIRWVALDGEDYLRWTDPCYLFPTREEARKNLTKAWRHYLLTQLNEISQHLDQDPVWGPVLAGVTAWCEEAR